MKKKRSFLKNENVNIPLYKTPLITRFFDSPCIMFGIFFKYSIILFQKTIVIDFRKILNITYFFI